jgi:hypothetical protein
MDAIVDKRDARERLMKRRRRLMRERKKIYEQRKKAFEEDPLRRLISFPSL